MSFQKIRVDEIKPSPQNGCYITKKEQQTIFVCGILCAALFVLKSLFLRKKY